MIEMYHWISSFHHRIYKFEQLENKHSIRKSMNLWGKFEVLPFRRKDVRVKFRERMCKCKNRCLKFERNVDLRRKTKWISWKETRCSNFSTNWNRVVEFGVVFEWNFSVSMDHWHQISVRFDLPNRNLLKNQSIEILYHRFSSTVFNKIINRWILTIVWTFANTGDDLIRRDSCW